MNQSKRYSKAIGSIRIICGEKVVASIESGQLVAKLQMIEVSGFDGAAYIPGMMSWLVQSKYTPGIHSASGRCQIKFSHEGKPMSGDCFYGSTSGGEVMWQGTGPLDGFDTQSAFNLDKPL